MDYSSRTIAITVTFNPDLDILRKQLDSLDPQCESIIIDNCSEKNLLEHFREYYTSKPSLHIISQAENIGISNAQNKCIQHVLDNMPQAEFVLLLDHDSVPSEGMIAGLEKEFDSLAGSGMNPAAIGPLLFDPRYKNYIGFHIMKNFVWRKVIPVNDSGPLECQSLNSSGSLISLEAIKDVGLLEKDFFMDHGETEWCFRAISKGYKIFGAAKVVMEHNMGDDICEYWLFGKKRMPFRSPLRHYYIIRNSLLLQRRPYVPFTWKFWNIVKIMFTLLYFGFTPEDSLQQRKFILRGIRDGFKGVTGKFPDTASGQA